MNVLKKIVFASLILVGGKICFAQEIGIRGGFNFSQMQDKDERGIVSDDPQWRPGFSVGPVIELPIYLFLSLETGLKYSTKGLLNKGIRGAGEEEHKYSSTLNIGYLELPIQIKASLPMKKFSLFGTAGTYMASGLYGTFIGRLNLANNEGEWYKVNWHGEEGYSIKRFDYGLNFGVGTKFKHAEVGISYEIGLANLNQYESMISFTNRCVELYLTLNLWKKNRKTNS